MDKLQIKIGWWLDWEVTHGAQNRPPVYEVFLRIEDRKIELYIPADIGPGCKTWNINTLYNGREWQLPFHLNPETAKLTASDVIGLLAFESSGDNRYTKSIVEDIQHAERLIEALKALDMLPEQDKKECDVVAHLERLLKTRVESIRTAYENLDDAVVVGEALRCRKHILEHKQAWRGLKPWDYEELRFIEALYKQAGNEEDADKIFVQRILEIRRTYLKNLPLPTAKDKEELAGVEKSLKELKEDNYGQRQD